MKPTAPMHVILVSLGTDGDVYPYIGLGKALRSRGHTITLVANEHFRPLAKQCGFEFRELVSNAETDALLENPDMWHPLKSALVVARWGAPLILRQYEVLAKLARDKNCIMVANPGVTAARLVQEELSVPLASVVLQPGCIPSVSAPPLLMGGLALSPRMPRFVGDLYWRFVDAVGWALVGRQLNRVRKSLNLQPVWRLFQWWISPERVIGLFPDWYGKPQADWPPQTRLAGFPMYDGGLAAGLSAEVLEFCRSGNPPVAFTFGTGMRHAGDLLQVAGEAARILGVRSLFLTKYRRQLPARLPPGALHCEFAPFQQLFPLCAAVVHHGGVGTVAKALATGTPQLIIPMAFDQQDNATRVEQLEAGCWLKRDRSSGTQIANALTRLMTSHTKTRCEAVAKRFAGEDALELAARWIEELHGQWQARRDNGLMSVRASELESR
jgi:rhamnosyltransferase subunit B